jgi:hypothetical protein
MFEVTMALTWLRTRSRSLTDRARARRGEEVGASIVETVVIIGLFVAAAIIIVGILVAKATQAANNVQTQ